VDDEARKAIHHSHSLPKRLYYPLSFNLTYSSFIFLFLDQTHIHSFACVSAIHTLSQRIPTLPIYLLFSYLYRLVTTTLDPNHVTSSHSKSRVREVYKA